MTNEDLKLEAIKKAYGEYIIYSNGDIVNKYGKKLKPYVDKSGYAKVVLFVNKQKESWLLHRIVAKVFIENKNNLKEINHIDSDKLNNSVENLEWSDRSKNQIHYVNTKKTKLNAISALEIKKSQLSYKDISFKYNISKQSICDIKKGRTWNHLK